MGLIVLNFITVGTIIKRGRNISMYCPKCGKEMPEGAQFCPSCGSNISPPSVSPMSQDLSGHDQGIPSTKPSSAAAEQQSPPPVPDENVKCPKCGATGCTPHYKQNVSGGGYGCCSGGLGALILGPLGLLCGACGRSVKTENTLVWLCPKCGHEFQVFSKGQMKRMYAGQIYIVVILGLCAIFTAFVMGLAIGFPSGDDVNLIPSTLFSDALLGGMFAYVLYKSPLERTEEQTQTLKKIAVVMGIVAVICFLISFTVFSGKHA